MKIGMGQMNLSRSDFWAITFTEFFAIWDSRFGHLPKPLLKRDLQEMMKRHPDGNH
jgi:uncharacterized phage protein (TIGR02216 family)